MTQLETTIKNLKKNRIDSIVLESSEELLEFLDSQIADGSIVGVGNLWT